MSKLTNKKLQEVKNNLYAVYTFDGDGVRTGTISGCNIVRMAEEAQHGLCLVFPQEINEAVVPREVVEELGVREGRVDKRPVWFWVLEVETAKKCRVSYHMVQHIFDNAKAWLKNEAQGGQKNEG